MQSLVRPAAVTVTVVAAVLAVACCISCRPHVPPVADVASIADGGAPLSRSGAALVFPLPTPQFTGESTPSYVLGVGAAAKMATVAPHARILVVLRNPVDRFYSEYVALCSAGKALLIVHASWGLPTCVEVVSCG